MISIERSETAQKSALEIQDKFSPRQNAVRECKRLRTQPLDLVEILYYDEQLQSMCCQSGSYS